MYNSSNLGGKFVSGTAFTGHGNPSLLHCITTILSHTPTTEVINEFDSLRYKTEDDPK